MEKAVMLGLVIAAVSAQVYEDHRCVCECPSWAEVLNISLGGEPKVYRADATRNQCNCEAVVVPHLSLALRDLQYDYCLFCDCKYQVRDTAVIKMSTAEEFINTLEEADENDEDFYWDGTIRYEKQVVVIGIVWILALMLVYMTFLVCLNPFATGGRHGYQDMRNYSDEEAARLIASSEEENERV